MALFKNHRRTTVVAQSTSGHSLRFAPGEQREVPEHLIDLALSKGLAPMGALPGLDDEPTEAELAEQAAELKAKRSAAAAKGAATKRAKAQAE